MLHVNKLLWLSTCLCVTVSWRSRLMGGEETTIEQYPYMAGYERMFWFGFAYECASTIIHKRWGLTAGHCVKGNEAAGDIWLRVGTTYRNSYGWMVPVLQIVKHENQPMNDLALLFMEYDFPLGETVKVVQLTSSTDVEVGTSGTVLAWGRQAPNLNSYGELRKVEVSVLPRKDCQQLAPVPVDNRTLCIRPKTAGSDACPGDSGGPLVVGDVQVGIMIRAWCTGHADTYIQLTNVGHFRKWIDNIIESHRVVRP